jgi:CRISPR-associated protein Cas1
VSGTLAHQNVHKLKNPLPKSETGSRMITGVPVWSERLALYGICDAVEITGAAVLPVEHKIGPYVPGGPADLQAAAQAAGLAEMLGTSVPAACVFSYADRRRHRVEVTPALISRIEELHRHPRSPADITPSRSGARPALPPLLPVPRLPAQPSPGCGRGTGPVHCASRGERGMAELLRTLYVTTPGSSLHLDKDAVRIYHPDQPQVRRLPLVRIDHIVAFGGITVTDDLLHRCAADHRSVTWLTGAGRFLARVSGPQAGNPYLRLSQHDHHRDGGLRLNLAAWFVAGKIKNARQVLLRAARDTTGPRQTALRDTAAVCADAIGQLPSSGSLNAVMGVEGYAARRYIAAWCHLLFPHADIAAPPARSSRPPTDPLNAALSFGYGLMRVAVHGAIEQVGLDPYIGFLHGIRPGKPALALDLMEEFRAELVDRTVFTAFNQRKLTTRHFQELPGGAHELTDTGRREFLSLWSDARTQTRQHQLLSTEVPAALLPLLQARILARYLRGDIPRYVPWGPA